MKPTSIRAKQEAWCGNFFFRHSYEETREYMRTKTYEKKERTKRVTKKETKEIRRM
jgi:hypothetical protein